MMVTVVIPTHCPDRRRLERTLAALMAQTLDSRRREIVLVDNASTPRLVLETFSPRVTGEVVVVRENQLGLTAARLRGIAAATGDIIVFVDDDNVLAEDYLATVAARFSANPEIGAMGGKSVPDFEVTPPSWVREFDGLLALRDLGEKEQRATWKNATKRDYPVCAPIGAGMALRRSAALAYADALRTDATRRAFDRTGQQLMSGGDNDIVMTVLEEGFDVAYVPSLRLTHVIPASRCSRIYLGRLNRAIARSWVRVLALHHVRPWPAIPAGTVLLRQLRAWLRCRAWTTPAAWVRWQGACGHFQGLSELPAHSRSNRA